MKKASENPYKKLEDTIMDKLFKESIMESVLNLRHLNTMHDPKNNTDVTLIDRVINPYEKANSASRFDTEKENLIENTIMDNIEDIVKWLKDSKNKKLHITQDQYETIGHGFVYKNGILREYTSETLSLILEKDDNNPVGFKCTTAYPDITPSSTTRIPTRRNLIPDLAQTRTFKKSDTEQRKSLIRSAMCSINKTPTPMDYVYADIVTDAAYTEDTRATFDKDEIRLIHYEGTMRANLNITKDSVKLTGNHSREMITLKKTAEQSIENRFGTKLNIQKIREPKEKQEETSEKTDKDLTKGTQFGE